MSFLKMKLVWIGAAAAVVVLLIFGLAMMGSVIGAKPKALPVALAVLDQPVALPAEAGGEQLALGQAVQQQVTGLAQLPVRWEVVGTEEEALAMMNRQEVYGALTLPADFTAGALSLQSAEPKPATVKLYVNEGMSAQGVAAVRSILQQVSKQIAAGLSAQALEQIGQHAQQLPIGAARALLAPVQTQEIVVHAVGENNGGGSAPNMLTQIAWMGSLVLSIFFFLAARGVRGRKSGAEGAGAGRDGYVERSSLASVSAGSSGSRGIARGHDGRSRWLIAASQTVVGLVLTCGVSGLLVWMAAGWYGMEIADPAAVWLFLWLASSAFFLLQSSLLNWIGMPAIALLVLLLFFSLPVVNLAPEFMPQVTQDWLYSWTPFRYVASGLRSLMYFGGGSSHVMTLSYSVLWWIAGVGVVVLLASGWRKERAPEAAAADGAGAVKSVRS